MMKTPICRKHKVVIHRCPECNDPYKLGMKIDCIECGKYLCYDCAVFENDESSYMMCPDCYKQSQEKCEECGVNKKVVPFNCIKHNSKCMPEEYIKGCLMVCMPCYDELVDDFYKLQVIKKQIVNKEAFEIKFPNIRDDEPFESSDLINRCGRRYRDGTICDEIVTEDGGYEFCNNCMEIECGYYNEDEF